MGPRSAAIIALLLCALSAVHAQVEAETSARRPRVVVAETGLHTSISFFGAYAGWTNSVVAGSDTLRLGGGLAFYAGTTQFDLHLIPFLRGELGWWYLGAGWILPVADRTSRAQPMESALWISTGISPEIVRLAIGAFGVDVGLEAIVPVLGENATRSLASNLVGGLSLPEWVVNSLAFAVGSMQARFGLTYTFPLNSTTMPQ